MAHLSKFAEFYKENCYSLLPNVEWFFANIFVTRYRSHMRVSALDSKSKLWHLIFLTFLVTLSFHFVLPLEMSGFQEHWAPSMFEALTFYIGFSGQVPDEYFPDVIESNLLHLNLTISILWWYAKLHYHSSNSFRVIWKKQFQKNELYIVIKATFCFKPFQIFGKCFIWILKFHNFPGGGPPNSPNSGYIFLS